MSEKQEKVEALRRLLIEGEKSGFTDCTLEQLNRELDAEANHIGSDFDDFLREEGILPEVEAVVKKRLAEERWRKENAAAIDAYRPRQAGGTLCFQEAEILMADPEWVDIMTLEPLREVEAALSAPIDDLVAKTEDQRNVERLYALYRRANELVGEVDLDVPLWEDDK